MKTDNNSMPEKLLRSAFKMKLDPGFKEEYKKRHDEIWPGSYLLKHHARWFFSGQLRRRCSPRGFQRSCRNGLFYKAHALHKDHHGNRMFRTSCSSGRSFLRYCCCRVFTVIHYQHTMLSMVRGIGSTENRFNTIVFDHLLQTGVCLFTSTGFG